ncbi:MAG: CvpA family protein [Deferribacteraceae bacterium]|jgi:uncharacterized membrane protein required for colicin V production|nr:CvpA family protein [Deferribacteraceae bacterium]
MELIDVVCIVFLIICLLFGFKRGLVFELLTVLVTAVAVVIAYLVQPMILDIVGRFMNNNDNVNRTVFLVSFVIAISIIKMLTHRLIKSFGEVTESGNGVQFLGAVLAVPLGAFYLGVNLWLIISLFPGSSLTNRINESFIANYMKRTITVVYENIDKNLRKDQIESFGIIDRFK